MSGLTSLCHGARVRKRIRYYRNLAVTRAKWWHWVYYCAACGRFCRTKKPPLEDVAE